MTDGKQHCDHYEVCHIVHTNKDCVCPSNLENKSCDYDTRTVGPVTAYRCGDNCNGECSGEVDGIPHCGERKTDHIKTIRELRNALYVAANRYYDLKLRCKCNTMNELQFRSLVESALSESENYKPDYEMGDPLDWRRRNE